jgi:antitoxin CptB
VTGAEAAETRLKRLRIRSWRRGIREMDLILGGFFDHAGADLDASELDLYEALLEENDHDIYKWFAGKSAAPEVYTGLLRRITRSREAG